jgi:hypothetical protein
VTGIIPRQALSSRLPPIKKVMMDNNFAFIVLSSLHGSRRSRAELPSQDSLFRTTVSCSKQQERRRYPYNVKAASKVPKIIFLQTHLGRETHPAA